MAAARCNAILLLAVIAMVSSCSHRDEGGGGSSEFDDASKFVFRYLDMFWGTFLSLPEHRGWGGLGYYDAAALLWQVQLPPTQRVCPKGPHLADEILKQTGVPPPPAWKSWYPAPLFCNLALQHSPGRLFPSERLGFASVSVLLFSFYSCIFCSCLFLFVHFLC